MRQYRLAAGLVALTVLFTLGLGGPASALGFTYSITPNTAGDPVDTEAIIDFGVPSSSSQDIVFHNAGNTTDSSGRHIINQNEAVAPDGIPDPADGPACEAGPNDPTCAHFTLLGVSTPLDPDADRVADITATGDFTADGCAPTDTKTPDVLPLNLYWNGPFHGNAETGKTAELEVPAPVIGFLYVNVLLKPTGDGTFSGTTVVGQPQAHYDLHVNAPLGLFTCPGSGVTADTVTHGISQANPTRGSPGGAVVQKNPLAPGGYKACVTVLQGTTNSAMCQNYTIVGPDGSIKAVIMKDIISSESGGTYKVTTAVVCNTGVGKMPVNPVTDITSTMKSGTSTLTAGNGTFTVLHARAVSIRAGGCKSWKIKYTYGSDGKPHVGENVVFTHNLITPPFDPTPFDNTSSTPPQVAV